MKNFSLKVPGKWILSGEHTVLRGGEALVFPLESQFLELQHISTQNELEVSAEGENAADIEFIFWSVFERALKKLGLKRTDFSGQIHFKSSIRFGAGLGASATLCSSLALWLNHLYPNKIENIFEFSRDLENVFHGESSGVDVAVALQQKPLVFTRSEGFKPIETVIQPRLYLSYTGTRGVTKDCVEKVKALIQSNPQLAQQIDLKMSQATQNFRKLLLKKEYNPSDWIQTLQKAHSCYEDWGLTNTTTEKHKNELLQAGALAIKLTGSGLGGYMLSLWDEVPASLSIQLIPCFNMKS